MINEEQIKQVFDVMVSRITKKGARNKMVSSFDISDTLKENGTPTSRIFIEAILDVLIKKKYVRYYRNEKNRIYYGITKYAWSEYDKVEVNIVHDRQNKENNEDNTPPWDNDMTHPSVECEVKTDEKSVVQKDVPCSKCGKHFTKRGVKRHEAVCSASKSA